MNTRTALSRFALAASLVAAPHVHALAPSSPGSVDPTYGADGVLALSVRSGYESANAIVPTPDGKWLVSGGAQSAGANEDGVRYLVRLNADGRVDTTFGNQGYVYDNYYSRVLIVQASGRILAASTVTEGTFTKAVLRRLLPDGSRDMAFGVANGETVIWTGNATQNYQDFEHFQIDAQGRIVATSRVFAGMDFSSSRVEVWRFSTDGIPDASFGVQGRSSLEGIAPLAYNSVVRIAADGRIVVAMWCQTTFSGKTRGCAARLGANGARDATFGPNGTREFAAPGGGSFLVYEVQVAPSGKVYIVGTYTDVHPEKGVVLGLNVDGTPDNTYGSLGTASLTSTLETTYLFWMHILPDGRQLLGGYSTDRQFDAYGFVARLTANGQPDLTFGTAGISTRVIAASHSFTDFAVLADGSVLGVGNRVNVFKSSNDVDSMFIRYVGVEIKTPVVEFYNGVLDHYFVTADPNEAIAIDAGAAGPGWARTGQTFKSGGPKRVCRFYGSPEIDPATQKRRGPNSHFYTIVADECAAVKTDSGWKFESYDFNGWPLAGSCPQGTIAVKRVYNKRFAQNDSNHRYVTADALYQQMIAQGWAGEGVVFCALA